MNLGQYVFCYMFSVKKNLNKRILIGLRKSYRVYKIGGSFMAFLLLLFFTCYGGDLHFFVTATLWRTHRPLLTLFWDHSHLYSNRCYKNALITV